MSFACLPEVIDHAHPEDAEAIGYRVRITTPSRALHVTISTEVLHSFRVVSTGRDIGSNRTVPSGEILTCGARPIDPSASDGVPGRVEDYRPHIYLRWVEADSDRSFTEALDYLHRIPGAIDPPRRRYHADHRFPVDHERRTIIERNDLVVCLEVVLQSRRVRAIGVFENGERTQATPGQPVNEPAHTVRSRDGLEKTIDRVGWPQGVVSEIELHCTNRRTRTIYPGRARNNTLQDTGSHRQRGDRWILELDFRSTRANERTDWVERKGRQVIKGQALVS